MKRNPMSRADTLLALVCECCNLESGKYFYPRSRPMWLTLIGDHILVNGSGDASAFRSLLKKGLVKSMNQSNPYACRITEEGILRYETVLRPLCDAEPVQVVPPEAP
jgi:hypothetical protein